MKNITHKIPALTDWHVQGKQKWLPFGSKGHYKRGYQRELKKLLPINELLE